MTNIARLNAIFDDPETRKKPLIERSPITKLLENELKELIDIVRPDFFMEIGAHEASFSEEMKRLYPTTQSLAVEANPFVHAHFQKKIEATGVEYLNFAVTSKCESVEIFIPDQIAGKVMPTIGTMSSILKCDLRDTTMSSVSVNGITLDELTKKRDFKKGCAWIDVEGLFKQVVEGANKTASKLAIVYAELETNPVWEGQVLANENIKTMEKLGFELVARDCQKWFQFNGLFIRKDIIEKHDITERINNFTSTAEAIFLRS